MAFLWTCLHGNGKEGAWERSKGGQGSCRQRAARIYLHFFSRFFARASTHRWHAHRVQGGAGECLQGGGAGGDPCHGRGRRRKLAMEYTAMRGGKEAKKRGQSEGEGGAACSGHTTRRRKRRGALGARWGSRAGGGAGVAKTFWAFGTCRVNKHGSQLLSVKFVLDVSPLGWPREIHKYRR